MPPAPNPTGQSRGTRWHRKMFPAKYNIVSHLAAGVSEDPQAAPVQEPVLEVVKPIWSGGERARNAGGRSAQTDL
jgi:hypothetical protein